MNIEPGWSLRAEPAEGAELVASTRASAELSTELAEIVAEVEETISHSIAPRTLVEYERYWRQFQAFCAEYGAQALPAHPDVVLAYLGRLKKSVQPSGEPYSISYVQLQLSAVGYFHKRANFGTFAKIGRIEAFMDGFARERAEDEQRQMRPLLSRDIDAIIGKMSFEKFPAGVSEIRDTFILLSGFVGAFRRSEPASMTHRNVRYIAEDGLHLRLVKSKGDQKGEGVTIPLPYAQEETMCVVCAYIRWARLLSSLDNRANVERTLFSFGKRSSWQHICREGIPVSLPGDLPLLTAIRRNGQILTNGMSGAALNGVVQRRAKAAGYREDIGFHSLRAGHVTQARRNGADDLEIMKQTRHKTAQMVGKYDRDHNPLHRNSAKKLGL